MDAGLTKIAITTGNASTQEQQHIQYYNATVRKDGLEWNVIKVQCADKNDRSF